MAMTDAEWEQASLANNNSHAAVAFAMACGRPFGIRGHQWFSSTQLLTPQRHRPRVLGGDDQQSIQAGFRSTTPAASSPICNEANPVQRMKTGGLYEP